MKVSISIKALKAVSRYMACKDVRYYLKGVFIEAGAEETRLVATTGHVLGIHRSKQDNDIERITGFIVPLDTVKAICKWKGVKSSDLPVIVTVPDDYADNVNAEFRAEYYGQIVVFKRIDGKFPDYQRVIPASCDGTAGNFNPEYLAIAADAWHDLHTAGVASVVTVQNGPDSAAVQYIGQDMVAVVIPIRIKDKATYSHAWAREPVGYVAPVEVVAEVKEAITA